MPYTEAFIYEVFRHASYVPFTIPHCTTDNITLNGYFIPKDTCVFINQYQVNHDIDIWGDAEAFRPERSLTLSGHLNKNLTEKVMIFGIGVRRCLGDSFARLEMFVFLTTLLHRLHIENVPEQRLDLSSTFGLTMKPKPFRIKISTLSYDIYNTVKLSSLCHVTELCQLSYFFNITECNRIKNC
uniref:unspecific monooxygenase n=1 Tax=Sinocyclocheilus rhinocerous TaxID=307959 RepID=A0A673MAE2_9TELE